MEYVGIHLWLGGVTILDLIMPAFGGTVEGIKRSTAMSLILLKNYQEQVVIHGGKADEAHRSHFVDKWESALGNRNIAVEVLDNIERDWMYTLHLESRSKNMIMDLIVSIHAKVVAVHQLMTYMLGILYYRVAPDGRRLKDCQHVAAHLLVFSHEGSNELLQSFIQVFDSYLSADDLSIITKFEEPLKNSQTSDDIIRRNGNLFHAGDQFAGPTNIEIELIERVTQNRFTVERITVDFEIRQQEHLLLKFMFGTLEESVRDEGIAGPIWDLDQMKFFWDIAEDINKYLTKQAFKSPFQGEFTMTHLLRAILIIKAERNNVSRKNVIEKFECMIPDNFEIFTSNNQVTSNANLEDDYY